jgi:hypothetical protein
MGQALTPRSRAAAGIDEARDMHQVIKRGAAREHPRAASHNKQQKRALSRGSGQLSGGGQIFKSTSHCSLFPR